MVLMIVFGSVVIKMVIAVVGCINYDNDYVVVVVAVDVNNDNNNDAYIVPRYPSLYIKMNYIKLLMRINYLISYIHLLFDLLNHI